MRKSPLKKPKLKKTTPRPHSPKPTRPPRSYTPLAQALSQPLTFADTELAEGIQRHSLVALLGAAIRRKRRSDSEPLAHVLCALLVWPLMKVKSIHCFCSELCQILAGQVSVLHDFLGREDINWRGLSSELARRLYQTIDLGARSQRAFVVDDTSQARAGRKVNSLATRASLLARLKDWDNQGSWQEFFDIYWQLIYRVAIKSGLTDTEAQDAVQETVLAVAKYIKDFEYDPAHCSFKSWLMLVTRQRIIWQLRKRLPTVPQLMRGESDTPRTSTVERIPDPNAVNLDVVWDAEWKKNLMSAAVEKVKRAVSPRQFQIFDLYALQGWSPREVARTLRISVAQVYLAKHRVSALLSKEVKKLEKLA